MFGRIQTKEKMLQTKEITALVTVVALLGLAVTACTSGVSQAERDALQAQLQAEQTKVAKLQEEMPTPAPAFGIKSETLDASGPPAYEARPGQWLAFVQSGMAYDSPADANYVSVVDVKSRKVLAKSAVNMPKGYQSHALGVSADARWVYVPSLSAGSQKLHILDGRTLKTAKTLDVGANTHHVDEGTYKQTGKLILVDTGNPQHGPIILDPNKNNEVVGQVPFGTVLGRPYSAWSSPDGSFAYITVNSHLSDQKGWISKIDLSTYKEIGFLPVGVGPVWVAFAADGMTAWVGHASSNDVMQIKVGQTKDEKDQVIATVPLTGSAYGMVLTHDGKKLYVVKKTYGASDASTSIYVVDTEAKKVAKEIKVGKQPDHVFLSPDGKEVWVGENRGNEVSIIDTSTDEVIGTIPMPGDVHSVRFVEILTASSSPAATPLAPPVAATPKTSATATPTIAASSNADMVGRGEKIYFQETNGCVTCHGKDATGVVGPNIRGKTAADIRTKLVENPQMQSLRLSDGEVEAVAAYLQSLAMPAR